MWVASDGDTTLYMLGTMHALPARTDWDDGAVGKAIAAADMLVLELSPAQVSAAPAEMKRLAARNHPLAMSDRLSPDLLAKYHHLTSQSGLRSFNGDTLDDWAITLAMGSYAATRAGLKSSAGVEMGLISRFQADRKPIKGLESARGQLMLFDSLPAHVQHEMLTETIRKSDDAVKEVHKLVDAWSTGNVERLHALIVEDADDSPIAMQSIYTNRNIRWTDWAIKRLDRPGTVLLAVGAGHLAGPDGLPERLAKHGIAVRRVQ